MGWVLAFLFFAVAATAIFVLLGVWKEKAALESRVARLEAAATSNAAVQAERDKLAAAYSTLRKRVQGIVDADEEKARVITEAKQITEKFNSQLAAAKAQYAERKQQMETEIAGLESRLGPLRAEHRSLSEEAALAELGYYKSHYGYATSERYKKAVDENYAKQKEILKEKAAATCSREWTIDGSTEKGRKQTDKYLAIMIRAFNGECDSAIAKVKPTNFQTMENRIEKAFEAINKLSELQFCRIAEKYKDLRIEELRLEHEHALKVQAERDEQRAIKEEMRQQAVAEREIERAQQDAEREERQYQASLDKARQDYEKASEAKQDEMRARLEELERMVAEAHENKERAISRAQQTRSGHVYVISNVGSFGSNVYKIGMTRRLDPMDRIWELSDASVPFDFDVHAIIYTEDAPGLETELHQRFAERRINVMNQKKEFFHATIDEIAEIVRGRCGDIELTMVAEATEFLQSEAYRRENGRCIAANRLFLTVGTGTSPPALPSPASA